VTPDTGRAQCVRSPDPCNKVASVHLVQATLGHSDLKTTGRYAHARPTESSATYLAG
jgi:integrase